MKEMPGFLSPGKGLPLLLIPEYSGINKEQRIPDRSKTAHRKPPVKMLPADAGRGWGQKEKGTTEDEMAGWHHQLYGHEFE